MSHLHHNLAPKAIAAVALTAGALLTGMAVRGGNDTPEHLAQPQNPVHETTPTTPVASTPTSNESVPKGKIIVTKHDGFTSVRTP